jgi:hypothetical protein
MGAPDEAINRGLWGWLGGKRCTNTGQKVQFHTLHISQKGSQVCCSSINSLFRQVYIIAAESGRAKIITPSILSIL